MSGPSSILDSLRQIPTADAIRSEHQISLIDTERRPSVTDAADDAEPSGSEAASQPPTPGPSPLIKKVQTNSSQIQQSVKRQLTKRKYAKYDRDRYDLDTATPPPPDESPASHAQLGEVATHQQASFLERSRAQAKSFLQRKRTLGAGKHDTDTFLDILYENQRGVFLFGIPKYSSSSLLPTDPKPWQNAVFRTSPVDIRNAQVPDPSWEWAWKSWYVDMSRDVDEEGWEYSFKFYGKWSWHGNHPWFHSFVRRRRWLRMRRRKDVKHHTREKAHELTAEYFTIHPKTVRPLSEMDASEMARLREKAEERDEEDVRKMEIADIGSLMRALRKAAVDREKLLAVRKFVDTAKDELYYLAERMSEIMALFIYQSSRRQLLADLLHRFDEAHEKQQDLSAHEHDEDEKAKQEHDATAKHAENLINAVHAADEQVKKLEFWSDIKVMAQHGDLLTESEGGKWDRSKWQGLTSPTSPDLDHPEPRFKNKQAASEGLTDLHAHAEHEDEPEKKKIPGERKYSQPYWDADEGSESTQGAYSTAAESVSQFSQKDRKWDKGKARVSNLDGVDEGSDEAVDEAKDASPSAAEEPQQTLYLPNSPLADRKKRSVQLVEPVPETADDDPTVTTTSSTAGDGNVGGS